MLLSPLFAFGEYGPAADKDHANFKIGDFEFDLTGTFTTEYNDNILSLPKSGAVSDLILTPGLNFGGVWNLSRANTLHLDLNMGYQVYVKHPELSSINNFLNMGPNNRLALKMKMGAFTVTPYDSLGFSTDATNVSGVNAATAVNGKPTTYARFINEIGVDILWAMNRKVEPYLKIFRSDTIPFKSRAFEFNKSHTYTANPGFNYLCATNLKMGIDFVASKNKYATNFQNSSNSFSLGPTINWSITPAMNFSGGVNYVIYQFKGDGHNQDSTQPKSLQWNLSFVHTPRANLQYSVFTSQSENYGYTSNTTRTRDTGISIQWRCLKRTTVRCAFVYGKGQDSGGISPEKYKNLTSGFGLDFAFTPRMTLSFDYEHTKKTSNIDIGDFVQNRIIFGLAYDF